MLRGLVEQFIVRLVLWVGLPVLLFSLAVGPRRLWGWVKRGWSAVFSRRMDPEQLLTQVVKQHEDHVASLRKALAQAEAAEAEIARNLKQSEVSVRALEKEASQLAASGDDLGAKADLYKLRLEEAAAENFREQLARQRTHIDQSRRRLYELEIQLRQFEVGRSVLLSQLAEAKSVEQQYEIANQFDPFSAVSNWKKAEGMVQEKTIEALAAERVHADTSHLAASARKPVDPEELDDDLAELKAKIQTQRSS